MPQTTEWMNLMKMLSNILVSTLLALAVGNAAAQPVSADVDARLRASLKVLLPTLEPDAIAESPLPGLYEVTFGTRIVYVSSDGRYLVKGRMVDLETRTEITEDREQQLKQGLLAGLDESQMIVYGDKDARHTVTVFTDIDCGYCRKLHSEMDAYNAAGIRVRYMAYPRAGIGSPSAQKAASVWCADDRQQAMDQAKSGANLPKRECDNPVAAQYRLGREFGINGTPALLLEDGSLIPGYIPAKRLAAMLDAQAAELATAGAADRQPAN